MRKELERKMMNELKTRVAVVGAGHAGIEAALASARMGMDTVLFTLNLDSVANLPCNPSIGGSGKGHLVFELDALGGEMGRAADRVTLQSRTLNLGKGAAVHSKRVQADRAMYRNLMKQTLEKQENLRLFQGEVTALLTERDGDGYRVTGVETALGEKWAAEKVILATGTYLESAIFIGEGVYSSGPDGLMPAKGLSKSLSDIGIRIMRFKTGTPARVHRRSIDFSVLEEQPGEEVITPFSSLTDAEELNAREQIPCHIVYTNSETHRILRENCTGCLRCTDTCYAGALAPVGKEVTADYVMKQIETDIPYYERSGGGVTFSGGECMLQIDFLAELLTRCRDKGIHTAVDTAGNMPWEYFEKIIDATDLFLYDVKAADADTHKALTGVSNERILENLRKLSVLGKEIIVRIPFVPTRNGGEMPAIAKILGEIKPKLVEIIPFHKLGSAKYSALDLDNPCEDEKTPSDEEVEAVLELLRAEGLDARKS